jgi:hypothetical protein
MYVWESGLDLAGEGNEPVDVLVERQPVLHVLVRFHE